MSLSLVPKPAAVKCHFKFVRKQGRGSNRCAVYACVACPYPSGCLPFSAKVAPKEKTL